jgi:hypothetical protein
MNWFLKKRSILCRLQSLEAVAKIDQKFLNQKNWKKYGAFSLFCVFKIFGL